MTVKYINNKNGPKLTNGFRIIFQGYKLLLRPLGPQGFQMTREHRRIVWQGDSIDGRNYTKQEQRDYKDRHVAWSPDARYQLPVSSNEVRESLQGEGRFLCKTSCFCNLAPINQPLIQFRHMQHKGDTGCQYDTIQRGKGNVDLSLGIHDIYSPSRVSKPYSVCSDQ